MKPPIEVTQRSTALEAPQWITRKPSTNAAKFTNTDAYQHVDQCYAATVRYTFLQCKNNPSGNATSFNELTDLEKQGKLPPINYGSDEDFYLSSNQLLLFAYLSGSWEVMGNKLLKNSGNHFTCTLTQDDFNFVMNHIEKLNFPVQHSCGAGLKRLGETFGDLPILSTIPKRAFVTEDKINDANAIRTSSLIWEKLCKLNILTNTGHLNIAIDDAGHLKNELTREDIDKINQLESPPNNIKRIHLGIVKSILNQALSDIKLCESPKGLFAYLNATKDTAWDYSDHVTIGIFCDPYQNSKTRIGQMANQIDHYNNVTDFFNQNKSTTLNTLLSKIPAFTILE
ncbi:MAG: hypothetical protein O3A77_01290 [bacterium]|nr:hypothetical protein [bacterium]